MILHTVNNIHIYQLIIILLTINNYLSMRLTNRLSTQLSTQLPNYLSNYIPGCQSIVKHRAYSGSRTCLKAKEEQAIGIDEIRNVRINKINKLKELGVNPFAYEYNVTHKTNDLQKSFVSLPNGQEDSSINVSIAGRITSRRVFGKLAFFELQDDTGTIQLYLEKNRLLERFDSLKEFTDVGDIIGVTGTLKRTDKGELSVYTSAWTILTKSLLPLPDKFHGLTDINNDIDKDI